MEIVERPSFIRKSPQVIVIACSALKRKYRDLLRGPQEIDTGLSKTAVSNCQVHFIYREHSSMPFPSS
jgi:gluconate kinase